MKKVFKLAAFLFASVALLLTSCDDPEPPVEVVDPFEGASLEVKLVGADITAATVSLDAQVLNVASYIVKPVEGEMVAPTAEEIFANGTMVALSKEETTQITLRNLTAETNYVTYWAGRISADKVWSEVKEFRFKTAAEPIIPVLTAELGAVDATTAEIKLYAENVSRIAYMVKTPAEVEAEGAPSIQKIFATGKNVNMQSGDNTVLVTALSPNTLYTIFIAGEIAVIEEYMEDIITVKNIKTTDFAEDVTVRDIHYRGFTVDVKVDPKVKEQNHMIKWITSDLYMYNMNSRSTDASMMNTHDEAWNGINLFNESRSLIIDEEHSYIFNDQGELEYWYYESIVPGQPQVFLLGEFRRGELPDSGWPLGYYRPMCDYDTYKLDQAKNPGEKLDEAPYWTGFYQNLRIQVQKPEPISEDLLDVEIVTEPSDARIKVWADKSIDLVSVMVLSELEYNTVMSRIKDTEHLQWFATSLMGSYEGFARQIAPYDSEYGLQGQFQTAISEFLTSVNRESKYWVYVVGMRGDVNGDGYLDGNEQVCKSFEFYLPQPTKPAPELVVTALEPTSPFEISFNIKCPTKDAESGCSIANYEKEWLKTRKSAQELLDAYGYPFTTVELLQINSDDGLTITYTSRPNEKTYLAAMIANDEGTETYSEAIIGQTPYEDARERVESTLFESLKGEWTASANVSYSLYNEETGLYDPYTATHSCTVTIGDFTYPETLREEDYATFEKNDMSREEATAYYEEFKAAAKTFNDNTRAQNRILMNGYDFGGDIYPYFRYADPYSLFVSETYNGYTSEMPIYDFGPKWFLEVAADGTVTAPFNTNYFTPMASWYTANNAIYESHFIAFDPINKAPVTYLGDEYGNAVNGHFPVEISEDGNTITLKPLVHSGISYYPNAIIYFGSGQYAMSVSVISEVTLTRNTSSAAAPAKVATKRAGKMKSESIRSSQEIKTPARPASRTAFGPIEEYKTLQSDMHLTGEQRAEKWFTTRRGAGRN
ncbi:MAG: hypothetical protein J6K24_01370 [Tidjanibacter sp.]|nr:hypothetical protein [Tidjanibacter sp.]